MTFAIRPGTPADLQGMTDVMSGRAAEEHLPLLAHELGTGTVAVAEEEGRVVGFGASLERDGTTFLSEMIVLKDCRSKGIGRGLTEAVFAPGRPPRCTLSSRDPRALALYARSGLTPLWPNVGLHREGGSLEPPAGVRLDEVAPEDAAILARDAEACGRRREIDLRFLAGEGRAEAFWVRRGDETIGYGYVQRRNVETLRLPDSRVIGPVGARAAGDSRDCLLAIAAAAAAEGGPVFASVPGPHPGLRPLLERGFRITYTETFMAEVPPGPADPRVYAPSGGTLF